MGKKIFVAILGAGFVYVSFSFLFPIAMGGILAVLFSPWLDRLERRKISPGIGAALLTLAITLVLIIPTALVISYGTRIGVQQIQSWKISPSSSTGFIENLLAISPVNRLLVGLTKWFPITMDELAIAVHQIIAAVGGKLADLIGAAVTQLPGIILALVLSVISVYFFLVGRYPLLHFCRSYSPFSHSQTERLIGTFKTMCRSVVLASVVSGAVQALIETVACILVGNSHAILIGFFVFLGSFVPLIGSAPITLGVALQQFINGQETAGVALLGVALVVMIVDNLVRPMFLRGSANLHPLIAFIAALGGLQTMGFFGIFLGPILAGVFFVSLECVTASEN